MPGPTVYFQTFTSLLLLLLLQLLFSASLKELISDHECSHIAGLIGQEQGCQILLTGKGRKLFYKSLEGRTIFTTLQFIYTVDAMIRTATGGLERAERTHGVAARIDGGQIADYPQLIHILRP